MGDEDELALITRWRAGDRAAGNTLFERHFHSVYRFFATKSDDADELVQQTFVRCLRSQHGFRQDSSFRTYLLGIARHTLLDHWRRRSKQHDTMDFDEISVVSLSTSAGSRLAKRADLTVLLAALRALPLEQQVLLELHYWEGQHAEQLAEVLEVEPATIRSRLFRARARLREQLEAARQQLGVELADDRDFDAWARSMRPVDAPTVEERG